MSSNDDATIIPFPRFTFAAIPLEELTVPPPPSEVLSYRVEVELEDSQPRVYRLVELAGDLRLDLVHTVLQEAMGWEDRHLHAFRPVGARANFLTAFDIGEGEEGLAEVDVRLDQVLPGVGAELEYQYDYGDNWIHRLRVVAVGPLVEGEPRARCVGGERACPIEDVGGIGGHEEVVALLRGEISDDRFPEEYAQWVRSTYDPDRFDVVAADRAVQEAVALGSQPVPAALAELVARFSPDGVRLLLSLLAQARSKEEVPMDDDVARLAGPWQEFLAVVGEGVKLTAAGYLPPAVVKVLLDVLEVDPDWPTSVHREADFPQVQALRHAARALGLVRVANGRLLPTKRGLALKSDPRRLVEHVAGALPLGRETAHRQTGALVLLHCAADVEPALAHQVVAELLGDLGWRGGGRLPDRSMVRDWAGDTLDVLRVAGEDAGLLARWAL